MSTHEEISNYEKFPRSKNFILKDETPVEEIEPGIKRQFLGFNHNLMAVRVWFEKDAVGQLHDHPHSQVSYVESGQFDITIGEVTKSLGAGDSFYVEPNVTHGAVCKEGGVLIDMFSPIREDFLENKNKGGTPDGETP